MIVLPAPPQAPPSSRRRPRPSGIWLAMLRRRVGVKTLLPSAANPRPAPIFSLSRPRRMKQGARSTLLWSLAFYALATVALDVAVDRYCPAPFEKIYREKWHDLRQWVSEYPDRPLTVMLGSSRTEGAFRASRLAGRPGPDGKRWLAYNFGVPASGAIHEYLYLREMLEQGIRPRLLLVEFLGALLNDAHSRYISEENWTAPEWIGARHLLRMAPYFHRPVRKSRIWLQARLSPWCMYRELLRLWLTTLPRPANPPNFTPRPHDEWGCHYPVLLTQEDRHLRMQCASGYVPTLEHFHLGKGPAQAMRDLLACCQREQIPVVLVVMPESTRFRSWYPPHCLAEINGLLDELRASYGVEVVDATRWLADGDFVDGHHLDFLGAEKFTARLIGEVEQLSSTRSEHGKH